MIFALAFVVYGWSMLSITLHEISHATVAHLLDFTPWRIRVGQGRRIASFTRHGVAMQFHVWPGEGITNYIIRPGPGLRWRCALVSFAGVGVNIALFGLLWLAWSHQQTLHVPDWLILSLLVLEGLMVLKNLVPSDVSVEGRLIPNDGKQVVGYLTGRSLAPLIATWDALKRALSHYDPKAPDRDFAFISDDVFASHASKGNQAMHEGHLEEAVSHYITALETPALDVAERCLILDVIAGIPIFQGDMSFLDRAVLWAKTALDLLPTCRTLRGTYGSLLIESGSLSEGMKMLTPLTEDGNEPTDKAIASAYLAKAHHLLGHANEAELWIARARELKASGCEKVCDRIEVEIRGNLPDVCPAPSSIS